MQRGRQPHISFSPWISCNIYLGVLINYKKSIVDQTQQIEFLAFLVHEDSTISRELPEGVQFKEAESLLQCQETAAHQLARMVGILSPCIPAITPAPLHYHSLQIDENNEVAQGGYNHRIFLSQPSRVELQWWCQCLTSHNGKPIRTPHPDLIIYTDASLLGWGATSQGVHIRGAWTQAEQSLHTQLSGTLGGVECSASVLPRKGEHTVLIWLDNFSAVAYINHMGGTRSSELASIAIRLWT